MPRKLTEEEIITNLLKEYPGSTQIKIEWVIIKNKHRIKVEFICGICGNRCNTYYDNIKVGRACAGCGKIKYSKSRKKYTSDFVRGKLDKLGYDWLNMDEYVDASSSLKTKCKTCGKISKANAINRLTNGRKCGRCQGLDRKTIDFVVNEVHELSNGECELISTEYINAHKPIIIRHKKCDKEFKTTRALFRKGRGCPNCASSKGEKKIENILINKNIQFDSHFRFSDCKFKNTLPFDFYLPDYNACIEYDGIQHFKPVRHFGGLDYFIDTKIRDTIKNIYCKDNNIKLIRIPYWEFENIEYILDKELKL